MRALASSTGFRSGEGRGVLGRLLLPGLLYLSMAQAVFTCFSVDPPTDSDARFTFARMLEGEADRPFVRRVLVPWLTRLGASALRGAPYRVYEKYRWPEKVDEELRRAHLDRSLGPEWLVFSWLSTALFALYGLSLYGLIRHFHGLDEAQAHAWSLVSLGLVPLFFDKYNQMYDAASLALFPLATWLLVRGRMAAYYLALCVALLNKETALLLPGLFLLHAWGREPWRHLLGHGLAQLALYLGVSGALGVLFRENAGSPLEWQFFSNLAYASTPSLHLLELLLKLAAMAMLVLAGWTRKPEFLRRSLGLLLAVLGPLWLLFGRLQELRVLHEAWFLIGLLALPTVLRITVWK